MQITRSLTGIGLTVAAFLLSACGGGDPMGGAPSSAAPSGGAGSGTSAPIVIGSADFTESKILAEIYAQALTAKGVTASTKLGIGSREVYLRALQDKSISVVPEYTGNLLLNFDPKATAKTAEEVNAALPKALPAGLSVLTPSAAVDQDVYVVTKDFSAKHQITSLDDLKKISADSTLGGPPELAERAYGPKGLESLYGAKFKAFTPYPKYPARTSDLDSNKIQVATFFTTDAVIADKGYVKLADPKSMVLPQNVVPLLSAEVAGNSAATGALNAVSGKLTTDALTALDRSVDVDHQDPGQVAGQWLKSAGLV